MRRRKALLPQVNESLEDLKSRMSRCGDPLLYQRLLALSWVAAGTVVSRAEIARRLFVTSHAVGRWLKTYQTQGIEALASRDKSGPTSQRILPSHAFEALGVRLAAEGFDSFFQAQEWLLQEHGVEVKYKSLWRLIKREFGGKLKVPRPCNPKKTNDFGGLGL